MRNYTVVGVTGPTGAGKSTITGYFKQKGCYIIDGDLLGRQSMQRGSLCLQQAAIAFGEDILNSDGTLNRQALAKKAFASPQSTALLNSITHPWICMQTVKRIDEIRKTAENPIIIFDAAVLLESHMDIICDYVLAVIAPLEVRKSRIMKRDGITEESAGIRINAQNKDEFYTAQADFVINGGSDMEDIYRVADALLKKIKEKQIAEKQIAENKITEKQITGGGLNYS